MCAGVKSCCRFVCISIMKYSEVLLNNGFRSSPPASASRALHQQGTSDLSMRRWHSPPPSIGPPERAQPPARLLRGQVGEDVHHAARRDVVEQVLVRALAGEDGLQEEAGLGRGGKGGGGTEGGGRRSQPGGTWARENQKGRGKAGRTPPPCCPPVAEERNASPLLHTAIRPGGSSRPPMQRDRL